MAQEDATDGSSSAATATPWLNIQEAADYLGVARQSIYTLMRRGELQPDGRVGRRWRFSRCNLDNYVHGNLASDSTERLAGNEVDPILQTKIRVC